MLKLYYFFVILFFALFNNCIQAQQCYFKQVSSKSFHSLGINEDGKLYGWGSNIQGQIGLGSNNNSEPTPILVGSTPLTFMVAESPAKHCCTEMDSSPAADE